jgi:DNA gyrase inhibitor GyrI
MMGVLTRSLPDMTVVCFDGFRPDPELTALQAMEAWLEDHEEILESHRVFGHNIDRDGRLSHEPENEGYRVMVTVPESVPPSEDGTRTMTIEGGKYIVTGIEGSFDEDPTGSWITAGWRRLHEMMKRNGIEGHPSHRYFEEHLEPVEPGRTRFDLYLEIV